MEAALYKNILQLKTQLETYVYEQQFEVQLNFSFFLNEYIKRQGLSDKEFAIALSVSDATISQYINNRRKPTKEFLVRLELNSCGLFPALSWMKLVHKEKEFELFTDKEIRSALRAKIKKQIDLSGN